MKKQILIMMFAMLCIPDSLYASCSNGYTGVTGLSDVDTFISPVNGKCELTGYRYVTIDDAFELHYSGIIYGAETTLCTNGYLSNGTCVSYSVGDCSSGESEIVSNTDVFISPVNGKCEITGYRYVTIDDAFELHYSGIIYGAETTLCTNGRLVDGTCVAYTACDGVLNYYDVGNDGSTFADSSLNACTSPYVIYTDGTRCDHNAGDVCVNIPTPSVDITWLATDGTILTTNTCYYGEPITIPAAPTRRGYTFTGWRVVAQGE